MGISQGSRTVPPMVIMRAVVGMPGGWCRKDVGTPTLQSSEPGHHKPQCKTRKTQDLYKAADSVPAEPQILAIKLASR